MVRIYVCLDCFLLGQFFFQAVFFAYEMVSSVRALARLDGMLQADSLASTDVYGTVIAHGYRCFLRYWAAGNYVDACMWARRMAEGVCMFVLQCHHVSLPEWGSLQEFKKAIPFVVSWRKVYQVAQHLPWQILEDLGLGMSQQSVWECLGYCQYKGNQAAHFRGYMDCSAPDEALFAAVVRMVLLFLAYRLPYVPDVNGIAGMEFRLRPVRSRL